MFLVHPASLVHPSEHSPAMLDMLHIKLNRNLINYTVQCTVDAVNYALCRPSSSKHASTSNYGLFTEFVSTVIDRAEITVPTLLVALVYIQRVKPLLSISLEQWACERVFLGALIIASKYSNDSTLKNVHWSMCTRVFGRRDVGRIEREFLQVLDWDLAVSEDDVLAHHAALISLGIPLRSFRKPFIPTTDLRCPIVMGDGSSWSDSDDSSSSASSFSPSTPSSFSPIAFDPVVGKSKLDVPARPMRPRRDSSLPVALEILKSLPIHISWDPSPGSTDVGCQPANTHYVAPTAHVWL